ncbi:MAG: hypothetical protein LUH55_09275, partial [Bacteroides thetaiotaomicron]|nr:hypothetical protein [Bacteroides thetaiotaomicron]
HEKWYWMDNVAMLLLLMFLDRLPNSRTAEISILALFLLENLSCYQRRSGADQGRRIKLWQTVAYISVFGCCILSFLLFMNFNSENVFLQCLPVNVVSRFRQAYLFWRENGLSLWGQFFDSTVYNYLDMLYAYLSLNLGVVVMGLVLFLNILTVWHAGKEQNERLLLILIVFQAYSLLEHEHFKVLYGFYPLLTGFSLWSAIEDMKKCIGVIIHKVVSHEN